MATRLLDDKQVAYLRFEPISQIALIIVFGRLWEYENAVGIIKRDGRLLPPHPSVAAFKAMLREEWRESVRIVEEARQRAAARPPRSNAKTGL